MMRARRVAPRLFISLSFTLVLAGGPQALAADVVQPAEVPTLGIALSGDDVVLTWTGVSTDILGAPESVAGYRVYRGTAASFVADKAGGSNRIGSPAAATFTDAGARLAPQNFYYLVSAVDAAGNEGNTRPSKVASPPTLSASFTTTAADLSWSGASPPGSAAGYEILWGTASTAYDAAKDAGGASGAGVWPLDEGITYHFSVLAYDAERNVAAFSNEAAGRLASGGGPTEVCGRISASTTWTVSGSPYVATCDVSVYADTSPFDTPAVPAVLTIEPGVVVKFNPGAGLSIGSLANAGGLVAQGTDTNPIVFTSSQTFPAPGAWDGIAFSDGSLDTSVLDRCVVEFGGAATTAAITLTTASPMIADSLITGSPNHGLNLVSGSSPMIDGVTIENVAGVGIRVDNASPSIRGSAIRNAGGLGITFTGPTSAVVEDNVIDHGIFFDNASGDPSITGNTIERYGSFVSRVGAQDVGELFASNAILGTGPTSRLEVIGERIETDAVWPDPGFPYVVVSGQIQVFGDLVTPRALTIAPGAELRFGVSTYIQAGSGANRGNLVAAGTPSEPILFTSSNASPAPGQWGGIFFDDGVDDGVSRLEHATVEYAGSSFSSGIRISGSSPAVRNCTVRNSSVYGIYLSGSSSTVEDCSTSSTGNNGIRSDGSGNPTLRRNTVASPTGYGLYVSGGNSAVVQDNVVANSIFFDSATGDPVISGNTFSNYDAFPARVGADDVREFLTANTIQGATAAGRLEILGEALTMSASWPKPAFPYVLVSGDITVGNSPVAPVTLTLTPGSVFKFASLTRIQVGTTANLGALVAAGTPAEPITFTTNNASPAPGQWEGIYFDDGTVDAASLLEHAVVEYAGQIYSANVRLASSSPTVRNCTVRHSSVYGVYLTGSTGLVENCAISSTGNNGVRSDGAGSPTLRGNTITSPTGYGIYVSGSNSSVVETNAAANSIFFDNAGGNPAITGNTFSNHDAFPARVGADDVAEFLSGNILQGATAAGRLEILGEVVTADATWPAPAFPYVLVSGDITVGNSPTTPVTLTLSAGTTLKLGAGMRLVVGTPTNQGALIALGTPSQPIVFTSSSAAPAAGQWQAIYFDDGTVDAASILDNVVVEYGGATYSANVRLVAASPTIRNSIIRNSSVRGIYGTSSSAPAISGNTCTGNAEFDVYLSGATSTALTGNTFSSSAFFDTAAGGHMVTGNVFNSYNNAARSLRVGAHAVAGIETNTFNGTGANSKVEILGETLAADTAWPKVGFPYAVLGDVVVAKDAISASTLTIEPGTELRFNSGVGLFVGTTTFKGGLSAVGTPSEPILFTTNNATPAPGQWEGIYFDQESVDAASILDNVVVEYAGQTYSADVRAVAASPTIRNSIIRNSSVRGIYGSSSSAPMVSGNTFTGNADFDVYLSGATSTALTGNTFSSSAFFDTATGGHAVTGNVFNNYNNASRNLRVGAHAVGGMDTNTFNGTGAASRVEVLGETLAADTVWPKVGFPYAVLGDVVVAKDAISASTLTIEPGTEIRFNSGVGLFAGTTTLKGALSAVGTPSEPILFTTNNATPAPGQWEGIYFDQESVDAASILENCVVEYAGQTYLADVRAVAASPTIRSCVLRNSSSRGVYGTSSSAPVVSGNTFTGNADYDAFFDAGSAILTGNTFAHAARFDSATGSPTVTGNTFNGYVAPFLLRVGAETVTGLAGNVFNGTNATSKIEVLGETLAGVHQWRDLPVPYTVVSGIVAVSGTFTVPARLTVDPGVTVRFGSATRLTIATSATQGELIAAGTPADPIVFTTDANTPAAGQWQGILFDNGTTFDTVLEHAVVEYAGQSSTAGIHLVRAGPPIRNVTVRFSSNYGVFSQESSPVLDTVTVMNTGNVGILFQGLSAERTPIVTDCVVAAPTGYGISSQGTVTATLMGNTVDNGIFFDSASGRPVVQGNVLNNYNAFPLRIGADSVAALTGNTFNGTGPNSRIEVTGEVLAEDAAWADLGMPYQVVSGFITVARTAAQAATLTLAPGITMKFASGTRLQVASGSSQGALVAVGTPAQPIVFTTSNAAPAPGQWRSVYFDSGTVDATSVLQHCVVEYAGQTDNANVFVSNAAPTIRDCVIRRSSLHGIGYSSGGGSARFNQIVDNAGYGVNLASSSAPALQHNTFTGNVSGAVNQTTALAVDGRFNWYGDASGPSGSGPGTGQSVSANVAFDPWLGAPFTTANYFADMFASTRTFMPGSLTRFSGRAAEDSSWTLQIRDTGGAAVRTIAGGGTDVLTSWDGRDDSAAALVDGPYTFRFDAVGNVSSEPAAPLIGRLSLDATFAVGEVAAPQHLQTFSIGTMVPVSGTAAGSNFTNYTLQFGSGLFPTSFTSITTSSSQVNSGALGTWNTTGQQNGTYTVRLLVNNSLAEQTVVNVGTFVLSVNTLSVNQTAFSPNGDGSIDEVTATAALSTTADWTLNVVETAGSTTIRTFMGSGQSVAQTWDGTLADGVTAAPEGAYRFDLTATRQGQMVASSSATTALDLTPPVASIAAPAEGAPVFTSIMVSGDAYDPDAHFRDYLLEYGIGVAPLSYTSIAPAQTAPVAGGVLGTWVTNNAEATEPIANGGYQIRLTASDRAGNVTRASRQVSVDNLILGGVASSRISLDTSLAQTATIGFSINKPATVNLKVYNEAPGEAGAVMKTVSGSFAPGTHSILWDGSGGSGLPLPDDAYIYVLEADAGSGRTDKYAPSGGRGVGSGSGSVDPSYNPYINDFWTMVYANFSPGRVTMQVTPTAQPTFNVFTEEAHETGSFTIEWDGRNTSGAIVTPASSVYFPPPITLRPNYILLKGDTPRMTGIGSTPYRILMSYAHVSRLSFTLERDATVTVKVLPPGVNNPSDPSAREIMAATPLAAGAYEVLFDPVDPSDPDEATLLFDAEGPYTFAVEAVNPATGTTAMRRGVVTMFR
jgi:parallel beta-helix repeat protein